MDVLFSIQMFHTLSKYYWFVSFKWKRMLSNHKVCVKKGMKNSLWDWVSIITFASRFQTHSLTLWHITSWKFEWRHSFICHHFSSLSNREIEVQIHFKSYNKLMKNMCQDILPLRVVLIITEDSHSNSETWR